MNNQEDQEITECADCGDFFPRDELQWGEKDCTLLCPECLEEEDSWL